MFKRVGCLVLFLFILVIFCNKSYSQQQDVDFHINSQLLPGKTILKVKRDFYDTYLWVLAQNNQVYRINSETLAIDDYTSQFAAYNNLAFIDIAGLNQDTVFIATNSAAVIGYKKGIIELIGPAKGLPDTVNSVGIANQVGFYIPSDLLIGTVNGLGHYNIYTDSLLYTTYNKGKGPTKIFTATYRNNMLTDNYYGFYNASFYPIAFTVPGEAYSYPIQNTVESHNAINTATYITMPEFGIFNGSYFWGNETGLYEESLDYDEDKPGSFASYLNNIKINKISDIIGLASLYDPLGHPLICKDNLLVGTDNGLYFSNSLYDNILAGYSTVVMFHYDLLGNIPINDVCVNSTTTSAFAEADYPSYCEDGVWLATNQGLYYIIPDYGKYLDPKTMINTLNFDLPNADTLTTTSICAGSSVNLLLNIFQTEANTIQWEKNGHDIIGQTSPTLAVIDSGDYYAILYSPCASVHISTNHLKVNLLSRPVFSFNYPDKMQYCDSASVNLNVTYNSAYHYRWYQDSVLTGDTSSTLQVTASGKYHVEVSACSGTWIPSKTVEVDLINLPVPAITTDKNMYCAGDEAVLHSNIPVDTNYVINWYKNGQLLTIYKDSVNITTNLAGAYTVILSSSFTACTQSSAAQQIAFTPAPVFTFNYPDTLNYCAGSSGVLKITTDSTYQYRWYDNDVLNGITADSITITQTGKYKVEASACPNSWLPSKEVQVNFIQVPNPVITANKPAYCIGDQATLSLKIAIDPSYTINWLRDGNTVDSYQDMTSISTSIPGTYTVSVTSKVLNSCVLVSSPLQVTFNQPPTVSIQQTINTTLCDGQAVDLKANYTNGTILWSTGQTTDQISVTSSGVYSATVTSTAGCVADTSITVQFLPLPVLALKDTTLCEFTKGTVTLTAPAGYSKYVWNSQEGSNTFAVSTPQKVSLTITDVNGCDASQQITVASQCPDVQMANTFTPNGDGINDTWAISGIENDPTVSIKVYNRYGAIVYQSRGYYTPWDGQYHGNKLPSGVYYYILTAKNGKQRFSGSVTIIY